MVSERRRLVPSTQFRLRIEAANREI